MGGNFLEVDHEGDSSAVGGYAKYMSKEWNKIVEKMLGGQCNEVEFIITKAIIPGRTAPIMVTSNMVARMKSGSVTVNMEAEAGGNVMTTFRDQKIIT